MATSFQFVLSEFHEDSQSKASFPGTGWQKDYYRRMKVALACDKI